MVPILRHRKWILFLGDVFLILGITWYLPWVRGWRYEIFQLETGASFLTLVLYLLMLYIFDLYNIRRVDFSIGTALRMTTTVGMSGLFSAVLFYYLPQWKFGRSIFLIQILLVWCCLILWRYLFRCLFVNVADKKKVLILGAGKSGKELYNLLANPLSPYRVVGFLEDHPENKHDAGQSLILGGTDRLLEFAAAQGIETVIVAAGHGMSPELMRNLIQARFQEDMNIVEMPIIVEALTGTIPVEHISDRWLLASESFNLVPRKHNWKLKYLGDFCVSGILLLIAAPLLIVLSGAIRLDSQGAVLYRQKRVGHKGKIFTIYKFRSMVENAEQNGPAWAENGDPRVTRVGRLIRFLHLDELPQLINVLQGEMSLVGPRPERPEFVEHLESKIPYYAIRHSARPGITGWAQVNFPYGSSVEDSLHKLEYDLFYIKNMSFILDIKIVLKTIGVVLFGQGAR